MEEAFCKHTRSMDGGSGFTFSVCDDFYPGSSASSPHNDKRRLVSAIYYKFLRTETTKGQAEKQCTKLFSVRSLLESSESRASVRWKSVVKVNLSSVWKSLCVNPVLVKSCSYCCWGLFGEKGPISTVYTGFAQVYGQMEINVSY